MRQIAENSGAEGSIVVGKVLDLERGELGLPDAQSGEYKDMLKAGIIDPTKVVQDPLCRMRRRLPASLVHHERRRWSEEGAGKEDHAGGNAARQRHGFLRPTSLVPARGMDEAVGQAFAAGQRGACRWPVAVDLYLLSALLGDAVGSGAKSTVGRRIRALAGAARSSRCWDGVSSRDPFASISRLRFPDLQSAVDFAERHGWLALPGAEPAALHSAEKLRRQLQVR